MVSWIYNRYVGPRKVQCPECGHEMIAKFEGVQCTVKGCRHRFIGNDHLYKTPDDRLREHREMYESLDKMESRLYQEVENIKKMKQKLKPLNKPKIQENESKVSQQSITQ